MFDQHDELRGNEGPEPERHVILVADSSPHLTGCRCNANEQYDNYSLSDISQELLKVISSVPFDIPCNDQVRLLHRISIDTDPVYVYHPHEHSPHF